MLNLTLSLESKPVTSCVKVKKVSWLGCLHQTPEKDVEFNIDATGNQKNELLELLNEYRDVLPQEMPHSLPPEIAINHDIDLVPESSPPSLTPYRLPKPLMHELQKHKSSSCSRIH